MLTPNITQFPTCKSGIKHIRLEKHYGDKDVLSHTGNSLNTEECGVSSMISKLMVDQRLTSKLGSTRVGLRLCRKKFMKGFVDPESSIRMLYVSEKPSMGLNKLHVRGMTAISGFLSSQDLQWAGDDPTLFTWKAGKLSYLGSRPDIVFAVCMCARPISWTIGLLAVITIKQKKYGNLQFQKLNTIALSDECFKILWMRSQLRDYEFAFNKIADVLWTFKSAIALCCQLCYHRVTRHIDIRLNFFKEQVDIGNVVELYFVRQNTNWLDTIYEGITRERFATLLPLLGVRQMSPETLKELLDESVSE
ncbi:hypothetical protein Tco_0088916 [Tanacetum coccineum]